MFGSLGGIFDNGVMAMMAQSQAMGAVSDNIANLATIGYKRSDVQFATLLGETDATGNATTALPPANQNGVAPTTRQLVNVEGSIQTTGVSTDVAVTGPGMFVFGNDPTNPTSLVYGRNGSFQDIVPTIINGAAANSTTTAYLGNGNGQYLMAYPVTGTPPTTQTGTLTAVQVSNQAAFAGQPTTTASLAAVIPAAGATTVSAPLSYIDANGKSQALTITWSNPVTVSGTSTTWNVDITDSSGNAVGSSPLTTMTFDNQGTSQTSSITIPATGASFTLDLSKVQMLGNATTTSGGSALAVNTTYSQNGLPAGAFQGITINPDGTVIGKYDGGASKTLYQIPLASFASPNNLQALAGNVYSPTQGSGSATLNTPGNGAGLLDVGAVEESNVDLGASFTTMILTQQAYNSAAQVLQVADKMTQVAANLKG